MSVALPAHQQRQHEKYESDSHPTHNDYSDECLLLPLHQILHTLQAGIQSGQVHVRLTGMKLQIGYTLKEPGALGGNLKAANIK